MKRLDSLGIGAHKLRSDGAALAERVASVLLSAGAFVPGDVLTNARVSTLDFLTGTHPRSFFLLTALRPLYSVFVFSFSLMILIKSAK